MSEENLEDSVEELKTADMDPVTRYLSAKLLKEAADQLVDESFDELIATASEEGLSQTQQDILDDFINMMEGDDE